MKKIKVPEEMLKAAQIAVRAAIQKHLDSRTERDTKALFDLVPAVLEAALLWLSEHPQVPTDEQLQAMREHLLPDMPKGAEHFTSNDLFMGAVEWQRRCFQEEEPEIPAEIEDLTWDRQFMDEAVKGTAAKPRHNACVEEAYRRGLRKGEQK